jgi:hypothetical protein
MYWDTHAVTPNALATSAAGPNRSAGAHLALFHLGGVALAALAGWAIPRAARPVG